MFPWRIQLPPSKQDYIVMETFDWSPPNLILKNEKKKALRGASDF